MDAADDFEYQRLEDKAAPGAGHADIGDGDTTNGTLSATTASEDERASRKREWAAYVELMVPTMLTFVCRMGMALTDLAFLGHLRADPRYPGAASNDFLAAAGIAAPSVPMSLP